MAMSLFVLKASSLIHLQCTEALFPDWAPCHLRKRWIHARSVYIPMRYLYGLRFGVEENDMIRAFRQIQSIF